MASVEGRDLPASIGALTPMVPFEGDHLTDLTEQCGQASKQIVPPLDAGSFANVIRLKSGGALRANHLYAWSDRAHRMRSLPAQRAAKFGGHGGSSVINLGGAQQVLLAVGSTVRECPEGISLSAHCRHKARSPSLDTSPAKAF